MVTETTAQSLAEFVGRTADKFPDRLAIASESTRYSYRELTERVRVLASFLLKQGVRPGEPIAVLTTPRADSYALFLAINAVGAIWLGINPRYTLPEVLYVVNDAQPRFLFFINRFREQEFLSIAQEVKASCPFLESLYCLDDDSSVAMPLKTALDNMNDVRPRYEDVLIGNDRANNAAILVYTSGSTGQPKGAPLSNRAMIRRSLNQLVQWPVSDYPRLYNPYPMNHIGSMHWVSSYGIVGEGSIHFREKFEGDDVPDLVEQNQINVLEFFPTMYKMVLDSPTFDPAKFASIEWHIFSGAQMPIELLRILDKMPGKIGTSYGMTETCGSVTYAAPDTDLATLAVTIGRSSPEGEVRVFHAENRICLEGEVGEIQVRRDYCTVGYFNRPDANASAFTTDGWFKSGDLAEVMPQGNLRFVGRTSDMFKSGGFNVYPREIELALEAHPSVLQAAVIGVPHPVFGEVGYAVVSLKGGTGPDVTELKEWCCGRLSDYKRPKHIEIRTELPLLPVGKVDKVLLRAQIIEMQPTMLMA
ncbi:class I adenylate-forming enzyme family protein [Pollutimonas bauzanensis]|uniref:class I adenylate-forming enzyme family protein n=1 Tax=Pollutimonas bauzanensis TaxID=658167 RepID=UPI003341B306